MSFNLFHLLDWLIHKRFENAGLTLKSVSNDSYHIEYWTNNANKPTLVLLHAFGAECKYSWFKQVGPLSRKFNLIVPNLVFFGNSTVHPETYDVNMQVEGISTLLRELNIQSVYLGAASYGGVIAAELIDRGEFQVTKLVLSNTPLKFYDQEGWDEVVSSFRTDKKSEVLVPKNARQLKRLYEICSYRKTIIPLFLFRQIYKHQYLKNAKQRRLLIDSFIEEQLLLKEKEYHFHCPVLLIWGANDVLAPLEIGQKLADYFSEQSELLVFNKTGHMPNLEKSKRYNAAVISFLNSNEK